MYDPERSGKQLNPVWGTLESVTRNIKSIFGRTELQNDQQSHEGPKQRVRVLLHMKNVMETLPYKMIIERAKNEKLTAPAIPALTSPSNEEAETLVARTLATPVSSTKSYQHDIHLLFFHDESSDEENISSQERWQKTLNRGCRSPEGWFILTVDEGRRCYPKIVCDYFLTRFCAVEEREEQLAQAARRSGASLGSAYATPTSLDLVESKQLLKKTYDYSEAAERPEEEKIGGVDATEETPQVLPNAHDSTLSVGLAPQKNMKRSNSSDSKSESESEPDIQLKKRKRYVESDERRPIRKKCRSSRD